MVPFQAFQFVDDGGHVKVIVGHCWLQKLFLLQGIENGGFGECPITRAGVDFISALPNL